MMTDLLFVVIFGLVSVFCPCKGQINLPPGGETLYFAKGTTANISWSFDATVDTSKIRTRTWNFKATGGSEVLIGDILGSNGTPVIDIKTLAVRIEKPATLILQSVDHRYNGEYKFTITAASIRSSSVTVIIAEKPDVVVNCSSMIMVNEGDYFVCQCKGKGGKPTPANVTWYDNEGKAEETGEGEKLLIRRNVKKTDSGSYRCEAKTHELTKAEKLIKLIVKYITSFTSSPLKPKVGETVTITCVARANSKPDYTIIRNGTVVSTGKPYIIPKVGKDHAGTYTCNAANQLGNDSESYTLVVVEDDSSSKKGLSVGAIVGIIVGVLVLVVIVVVILCYLKLKSKDRGHERVRSESNRAKEQPVSTSNQPPEYATLEPPEQLTYAALDQKALKKGAGGKPASTSTPTEYAAIQVP